MHGSARIRQSLTAPQPLTEHVFVMMCVLPPSGYLAFIGQYCLEAAIGLMSRHDVAVDCTPLYQLVLGGGTGGDSSPAAAQRACGWAHVWAHQDPVLIGTGVVLGLGLWLISSKYKHFAALPCAMLAIPALFYLLLALSGTSFDEARDYGWLKHEDHAGASPSPGEGSSSSPGDNGTVVAEAVPHEWPGLVQPWQAFYVGKIQWGALSACIPTWFAMYFVVAFSSCLDIAAIQLELGRALDFDREIRTVGLANLFSGCTGGFTGASLFMFCFMYVVTTRTSLLVVSH